MPQSDPLLDPLLAHYLNPLPDPLLAPFQLRHTLTGEVSEITVDHIVVEQGVSALTELYEALKPFSNNAGMVDVDALAAGKLHLPKGNADGQFDLVRIGDAISSRNLHAAIYDALRMGLCIRR